MRKTVSVQPVALETVGMVNALGHNCKRIQKGVLRGFPATLVPDTDSVPGRTVYTGVVKDTLPALPDSLRDLQCRNNALLLFTYQQIQGAVEAARERYGSHRIGIVLGSSTTGIQAGEQAIQEIEATGRFPSGYHYVQQELGATSACLAAYTGLTGPCYTVSTACSSSAKAFASARNLLLAGLCDAVIVGGVDTLCHMTLQGFSALGAVSDRPCLPMSRNRSGINIGEGAALFLMTRGDDLAHDEGIWLYGVGESSDAHHISAPEPEGRGALAAMQAALQEADVSPEEIGYINLHGTATPLNDAMESKAVDACFGTDVPCSSTKPQVGHMLGAAGATEVGFCWLTLQQPGDTIVLPPHVWDGQRDEELPALRLVAHGEPFSRDAVTYCLSNSFAFGGNNCSVIIGRSRR
jgi:3-oxoacyl-[acyl-carrier-protein] synthase-1